MYSTYNFVLNILSKFRKQTYLVCQLNHSWQFVKPSFKLIRFCLWNFVTSTLDLNWSPLTRSLLGMTWYFSNLSFYNPQLCLETSANVIKQTYHTMLIKSIAEVWKINGKLLDDTKKRSQTGGWKTNILRLRPCVRTPHTNFTPPFLLQHNPYPWREWDKSLTTHHNSINAHRAFYLHHKCFKRDL